MSTILTDHERREIHRKAALAPSAVDALIAETEAAVLAKLLDPARAALSDLLACIHRYDDGSLYLGDDGDDVIRRAEQVLSQAPQAPQTEQCHKRRNDACGCSRKAMLCDGMGQPQAEQAAEPVRVTDSMAYAFHNALSDGAIGEEEVKDIKRGLRAALASTERQQAEQAAEPVRDAEDELNCAEEVLDGYAAHLDLEQTAFDCIGDYITAVCEALKARAALASTERQPPAQWQEAMKVALGEIAWSNNSQWQADRARAALAQLDSLSTASMERQPLTEWEIRGELARLKCWHRLTEQEAADLVEFASAHGIGGKEQG